jgi:hypothetical protein
MADLTEEDVAVLDSLLHYYLDLVYLPEAENQYRTERNNDAKQTRKAIEKQPKWEKALLGSPEPPELVELADISDQRKRFEKLLADDLIAGWLILFAKADLYWNESVAKDQGRLAAIRLAMQQWAIEEWHTALPPPSTLKFDTVVAAALPSGVGFIGPRSRYEAAVRSEQVARALQTLQNIAGGFLGAAGYFVGGDAGSDIGAGVGALAPGGNRGARARRRNSRRRAAGSKGTSVKSTGNKGTRARAVEATGVQPIQNKRRRTRTPTAPPQPAAPAAKQPERRSSEQRAEARKTSAQAAAAGEKLSPKVQAKLEHHKVDVKDPYTREKLNEIFATNRNDQAPLQQARANSGELRALVREGHYKNVKSVRFLRPGQKKDDRTPDIEVTMNDGSKKFVEVRTVTGAMRDAKVKDAKSQRAPISGYFMDSVDAKLRRGQISEKNPGKILFHAPFQPITKTGLEGWREMLGKIRDKGPLPKGIQSIEVTGAPDKDGTTNMLIFKPPGWQGVFVQ